MVLIVVIEYLLVPLSVLKKELRDISITTINTIIRTKKELIDIQISLSSFSVLIMVLIVVI